MSFQPLSKALPTSWGDGVHAEHKVPFTNLFEKGVDLCIKAVKFYEVCSDSFRVAAVPGPKIVQFFGPPHRVKTVARHPDRFEIASNAGLRSSTRRRGVPLRQNRPEGLSSVIGPETQGR